MYENLLAELTAMNGNAKALLEKYDNAGIKLDDSLRLALIEISDKIASFSTSGTFTAELKGKYGSTTSGTAFTKNITGNYHLIGDRVFIDFPEQLINGSEGNGIGIYAIGNLPFEAKEKSHNGVVYGRGTYWKYGTGTSNYFTSRVRIYADSNELAIEAERTDTVYSGWIGLRTNDSGSRIASLSLNYKIKV